MTNGRRLRFFLYRGCDVDMHNTSEVLFRLCANADPATRQHL